MQRHAARVHARLLAEEDLHAFLRKRKAAQTDQQQRQRPDRKGRREKGGEGEVVIRIEIEILRVAHGREHAAQVGRDGLQNDDADQRVAPLGHAEHDDGEGHEGQQGDVVGDEHGRKEAQPDQQRAHGAQVSDPQTERVRQMRKKTRLPQPGHHRHQTVEQRQRAEIDISEIPRVGRDEKAADRRGERGNEQHRLAPDKGTDRGHESDLV